MWDSTVKFAYTGTTCGMLENFYDLCIVYWHRIIEVFKLGCLDCHKQNSIDHRNLTNMQTMWYHSSFQADSFLYSLLSVLSKMKRV